MAKYVYVQALVTPASPEAESLTHTLVEAATGKPQPDVLTGLDPSSISFRHAFVEAEDDDGAYDAGFKELEREDNGGTFNDYVIKLP